MEADIVEMLEHAERETAKFDKLDFTIALNYGGRDELRRTMTKLAKQVQEGTLAPEAITEDVIAKHLDTADLPDPDLLIRTSGELRLSNYLIWQLAYAEFYFTDTLWPDFDKESLKEAIRNASALSLLCTLTSAGLNSRTCFSSNSILFPAAKAPIRISALARTTSSVCVPIEPVEPIIAIVLTLRLLSFQS